MYFHDPPQLELLYGIAPDRWNKGLATEAAIAMIGYGFEVLGFERIEASTDALNAASVRVMARAGMRFWKREITNGLDNDLLRCRSSRLATRAIALDPLEQSVRSILRRARSCALTHSLQFALMFAKC